MANSIKDKTCCFTGHRKIDIEQYPVIELLLKETIGQLVQRGYRYFGAGGAIRVLNSRVVKYIRFSLARGVDGT